MPDVRRSDESWIRGYRETYNDRQLEEGGRRLMEQIGRPHQSLDAVSDLARHVGYIGQAMERHPLRPAESKPKGR